VRHTRILVTHQGGPDALRVVEEECPEPKGGEVRVRVLAAGVSLPDVMMREGIHPETPPLPFTPGWDLVGVVDRLGAGFLKEGHKDRGAVAGGPTHAHRVPLPHVARGLAQQRHSGRATYSSVAALRAGVRSPMKAVCRTGARKVTWFQHWVAATSGTGVGLPGRSQ
jgi:NADPH:quinone reductase-like Zn-dependent oxidoreductase